MVGRTLLEGGLVKVTGLGKGNLRRYRSGGLNSKVDYAYFETVLRLLVHGYTNESIFIRVS